jgi:hypothetical protein
MKLHFSARPGCWERHLQRKQGNLLFPESARRIKQSQVDEARRRDEEELWRFTEAFQGLMRDVMALPPQADSELILKLKERVDKLYEEASGLAGDLAGEKESLRRIAEVIMKSIWAGIGNDAQAHRELEQEEAARTIHYRLLEYPIVAHLLRPDSPITEEDLVPTLLSEEEADLRAALALFDLGQQRELCRAARALLLSLKAQDVAASEAWARLEVMENAMASGPPS